MSFTMALMDFPGQRLSFEGHRSYEIKVSGTGGVSLIVGAAAKDGVTPV